MRRRTRLLWSAGEGKVFPWPVLSARADIYANTGCWDKAGLIYEQSLSALEEIGDRRALGQCLSEHGYVLMLKGDYQEAEEMGGRSLALGETVGNGALRAKACNLLGNIANNKGCFSGAVYHYTKALEEESGDTSEVDRCALLKNLGVAYYELGDYKRAVEYQKRALAMAEAGGRLLEIGAIYLNLGVILQRQQQYQEALGHLDRALAVLRRIGSWPLVKSVHNYFGIIYSDLGQVEQALQHYQAALEYSRGFGDQQGLAAVLNNLGTIQLNRGCYQEAAGYFTECLLLCRNMQHKAGIAIASFNLGEIAKDLGDHAEAEGLFGQSLAYAREQEAKYLLCQVLAGYTDLRMRQGRRVEAEGTAREALAMALELNLPSVACTCRLLLARMAYSDDAGSALERMKSLADECPDDHEKAEALFWLYKLGGREDDRQAALELLRRQDTDPENRLVRDRIKELEQG